MNNNYSSPQPRRVNERLRRRRRRAMVLVVFLCIAILVALLAIYVGLRIRNHVNDGDGSWTTPTGTGSVETPAPDTNPVDPVETSAPETEPPTPTVTYKTISLTRSNLVTGDLILVNASFPYSFPASEKHIKTVYGNKTSAYKVRDAIVSLDGDVLTVLNQALDDFYAATGDGNILFNSGYRDYDFQKALYDKRVVSDGEAEAAKYVALPGNSEHHTGLAFDLTVYTDEGKSYTLGDFDTYNWITENFPRYGFVLRYPENKVNVTGIGYEPWHFRYVGIPHAVYMTEQGLCLEEYINTLRAYQTDDQHLFVESDGVKYEIWYVPVSPEGDVTEVKVPEGVDYSVSGNNLDGFIITLTYGAA